MRFDIMKRIAALTLVLLLAVSLFGCSSKDEPGSVVGIWQSPPVSGTPDGFIYELTENGRIISSFGGFLYGGGTYEVKGDKLTLMNYPSYHTESLDGRPIIVIDYITETEYRFELSDVELRLTLSGETTSWTRTASVIPTPTPTPTPPPPPTEPPTPVPEVSRITVLYEGAPLRFTNEFSQRVGTTDGKFSVEVRPDGVEVDINIMSDNEDIFTVERIEVEGVPNAFQVTAVELGAANLIVTAGYIEEVIIVRILE